MKKLAAYIFLIAFLMSGCNRKPSEYENNNRDADIFPPYAGTVIPYNIAPLNFMINENAGLYKVRFVSENGSFEISTRKKVDIPLKKWKKLMQNNVNKNIAIQIFGKKSNKWEKYNDISFAVAAEPVDSYLAYRLIEPGYESWGRMGIYQRCLENFKESPVLINSLTDNNCMNCHTFSKNNPDVMLFHLRGQNAGTLFAIDGEIKKVDTKAPWAVSAGVYPRWHPDERFAIFSANKTNQGFLTAHTNKIEVFDLESDLFLYDTQQMRVSADTVIASKIRFETFPEWSPCGRYLYFCSAPALKMPNEYESLRYDLLRIAFDPETGEFSGEPETVVAAAAMKKSVSMPRISPDGRYLIFCMFDYGTFPIWHRENDLYLLDLESGKIDSLADANSTESDSYHSWSSSGRWMVFGSRRLDGSYTRPFIAYFDENGQMHKPFVVPQKNPEHYNYQLKSYNIPEFITGKIKIDPRNFAKSAKDESLIPDF